MRKRQGGQAFILVLILLAIGAMLLVPSLSFASTSLKNSQIAVNKTRALYAANAGQEWVLWSLTQPGFTNDLPEGVPVPFDIDVCGTHVDITIVMLALEGQGGLTLATDDVIKPTKTVEPDWVPDKALYNYTYTISLEQLSGDNSQGLDAIYDLPPGGINDYIGPSEVFIDGEWHEVPDPYWNSASGYLVWPADYDWETETGAFSSDPGSPNYFYGIRDFDVREVKKLRFTVRGRLNNNEVHCNWVVLKPWNTVSGPQAPINVGTPDDPGLCDDHSVLEVTKESSPSIILPGVVQEVTYTISITNMYTQTRNIETIIDYLPPGFVYVELISSEMENPSEPIVILEPEVTPQTINDIERQEVLWTQEKFPGGNDISIASNQILKLTFTAQTTQDVSGSYYNEVIIILRETGIPSGFSAIGVSPGEYGSNYSWNTGAVMVPYYDSEVDADGTTIDSNLSIIDGGAGAIFTSWQVY